VKYVERESQRAICSNVERQNFVRMGQNFTRMAGPLERESEKSRENEKNESVEKVKRKKKKKGE
jgi:hypothetical protein